MPRLADELPRTKSRAVRLPQRRERTSATGFTLLGHDIAKLDRFLGQAPVDYEGKFFGQYDPDAPPAPRVAADRILETTTMSGGTDVSAIPDSR